jgi:Spy/CpxP family protein refolding chaperone
MTNDANVTGTPAPRPGSSKLRWAWLLALPLAGALSVSAAQAGQGRWGAGHGGFGGEMAMGGGRHLDRLLGEANATDAQKAQIKAAWDAARPQLQALHQERMKLHEELQKALAAPTIDRTKVEALRKQSVQLMDKASTVTTQAFVTSAQVLTPEQRQKVATAIQQHRGRRPHAQPRAE